MGKEDAPVETKTYTCPIEAVVGVIGGKWKCGILFNLLPGPRRFGELRRAMGPITEKMLIQQLRELEADGVVHRELFPEVPPKVEYSLTEHGQTLQEVLQALCTWGKRHLKHTSLSKKRRLHKTGG
jgi:DNA-binding HxlR family transcriptional regulator